MSEQLGQAVLELDVDQRPLDRGLLRAERRIATWTATMQALLDRLHLPELEVNLAAVGDAAERHAALLEAATARVASAAVPGPSAPAAPRAPEAGAALLYGVRGPRNVGSVQNPLVFVMEAAKRTPMGSYAAAVGYDDTADVRRGDTASGMATAAQIAQLAASVSDLASALTPGSQLAQAGQEGIGEPSPVVTLSPGDSQTLRDTAAALAGMERQTGVLADAVRGMKGAMSSRGGSGEAAVLADALARTVTQRNPAVAAADSKATQDALVAALDRVAAEHGNTTILLGGGRGAAGSGTAAFVGGRGAGNSTGGVPVAFAWPGQGGGGGGPILPVIVAGGGGGGGGSRPVVVAPGGGGNNNPLLRNLLWGGAGGLFGLAGAGSLGSLAGLGPEHVIMTAAGLLGSAGAGLFGGGLLGAGALGAFGVGGGSDIAVMKSTITDTQTLSKAITQVTTAQANQAAAQKAYSQAVATYGKNSTQAAAAQSNLTSATSQLTTAQQGLNQQMAALGNTAGVKAEVGLAKAGQALDHYFDVKTSAARVQAVKILMQGIQTGHTFVPLVADAATRNLSIINRDLKPLTAWLNGPAGIGIFHDLENVFAKNLPYAMGAFDNGVELLLRIVDLAAQHTGGFTRELDKLFTRWNSLSNAQLGAWVDKYVNDFRVWEQLAKYLILDLDLLFRNDAGLGNSIVESLTQMLIKFHEWELTTSGSGQLHNIFEAHKQEVLALLQLIPALVKGFGGIELALGPPVTRVLTVVVGLVVDLVNALDQLSPLTADLLGVGLVLAKLGVLSNVLRGVGGALGIVTAAEQANTAAAGADAAATGGLATAETAVGDASVVSGAEQGAGGGLLARAGLSRFGFGAMGGSLAARLAGGNPWTASILAPVATGALAGGAGILGGSIVQHAAGLPGGTLPTIAGGVGGAGVGAAIGTIFDPISLGMGTFIGAGIGATLGPTIEHLLSGLFGDSSGVDHGKRFASGLVKPLEGIVPTQTGQALRKQLASDYNAYQKALAQYGPHAQPINPFSTNQQQLLPGDPAKLLAAARKYGQAIAAASIAGLNDVKDPSTYVVIQSFLAALAKAPARARPFAAKAMLEYAAALQQNKELPAGALKEVLHSLEAQFPALAPALRAAGVGTDRALARTLKLDESRAQLTQTLGSIRHEFGLTFGRLALDKDINGTNLAGNITRAMLAMREVIRTSTGQMKQDALTAFRSLQAEAGQYFARLVASASTSTGNANRIGSANFQALARNIAAYIGSGAEATSKGLKNITDQVNAALKGFGEKPLTPAQVSMLTPARLTAVVTGQQGAVAGGYQGAYLGHAAGGFTEIGRPGRAGRDTVPMMVGSAPFMVAEGETVATFNRHQRPIVDRALAREGYAGLPGLFASVTTPNYMAAGGIAAGPTLNYAQLEGLWDQGNPTLKRLAPLMAAIAMAESSGRDVTNSIGAAGYWQIYGLPFPGNPLDPLTNSRMAGAKYREQGLQAWVTYVTGAYKQFLHGGVPPGLAGALATITAPHVTGTGALATITRSALDDVAKAANVYLGAHSPAADGPGGFAPGTVLAHGGKPAGIEQAMMAAASQILGLPYVYGGGHGSFSARGYDCSGAVSYLLHAAGLLPAPETTVGLEQWGVPGFGKYVTVGVRGSSGPNAHTMISFFGKYLEAGGGGSYGKPDVHWDPGWDGAFTTYRHPRGLASGGLIGDFGEVDPLILLAHDPGIAANPAFRSYAGSRSGGANLTPHPKRTTARRPAGKAKIPKRPVAKPSDLEQLTGPGVPEDVPRLTRELNALIGTSGAVNRLGELLSYWPQSWAISNPLLGQSASSFIVTTDAQGNAVAPYINQPAVSLSLAELGQELGWETSTISDLQRALSLSLELGPLLKQTIAARKADMNAKQAKIRANLAKIKKLREQIAAAQAKGRPDYSRIGSLRAQISAEYAKQHPDRQRIRSLYAAISAEYAKTADKAQIAAWQKQVSDLEAENVKLGGSKTTVGTRGEIGAAAKQITSMQSTLTTVEADPQTIAGVSGLGGELGPALIQRQQLDDQLAQLSPTQLQRALASAVTSSGGAGSQSSTLASLLQQQSTQLAELYAVSQAQYAALTPSGLASLPPFGGSFADGGVVPGPVGAARTIIAHGGEVITPPNVATSHTVIVEDGAVDPNKIRIIARDEVTRSDRGVARYVRRGLPSRGGGQLVAR